MVCRRSTPTTPPWVVCTVWQPASATVAEKPSHHAMNLIFPPKRAFSTPRPNDQAPRCPPRIMPPLAPSARPSSSKMSRIPRSVFFLLFTVSGFAGLIYESIWSHYLKLFLGHAAYAQTLVLALFMGGMAIGSWLCSRWSGAWGNLLRGYALAEALIGLAALAFHPVFVAATDAAYASVLPALGGEIPATLFKWTLAGLLILPQSVLLGMTFPLMSAGLIRRYLTAPGESLAMLYFTNSFGASIGVLASGFVMIEKLGLPGTVQSAGALNLALATAVWLLARGTEEPMRARPRTGRDSEGAAPFRFFLTVALLTGAASFVFEIGWIRMLSLVLGSSTHSFELMLSAFILGLACGGYWLRRRIDSIADPLRFLGIVLVTMGLLALATLPLYGEMFGLMQAVMNALAKTETGYTLFLFSSHGIALAIMFPATFCAGITLPLITYALLHGGHGEMSIGAINMAPTGPRVSDEITMTLTAAIPLAYRPDAASAAVIGIGTGLTTHTLLGSNALRSVETIEIEPAMAEASRRFSPRNTNAFADPRSHIFFDDAKTFFSTHNGKYDIIISEPSNPWVSGVSSLFTGEFYRLARRHLNPDGILVQWFQMYEIDASLVASVLRALGENFPDYAIYAATGSDLLIIAGETRTLARPLADLTAMPGVARELRRVHVNSIWDIEVRRLGGKRSLAPMFPTYGVPANSDFYPYLDLHAAKYRFLQRTAAELTGLLAYSVPVVALLEGSGKSERTESRVDGEEYLEALQLTRRARYARDFLLLHTAPEPVAIPRPFQKDLELTRARLIECRDPERSDIWFHSLYQLARTMNPMLSPDDAKTVWERIERGPCSSRVAPDERQWIDLMKAVGNRAAPDMARLAEALLAKPSDLPAGHRQYLMAAGMAGYLAQGKRAEAGALWSRYPKDVDKTGDVGLRLLYAHAFELK